MIYTELMRSRHHLWCFSSNSASVCGSNGEKIMRTSVSPKSVWEFENGKELDEDLHGRFVQKMLWRSGLKREASACAERGFCSSTAKGWTVSHLTWSLTISSLSMGICTSERFWMQFPGGYVMPRVNAWVGNDAAFRYIHALKCFPPALPVEVFSALIYAWLSEAIRSVLSAQGEQSSRCCKSGKSCLPELYGCFMAAPFSCREYQTPTLT